VEAAQREGAAGLPFQTASALTASAGEAVPWCVTGCLAKGSITELTAAIKTGKSTWACYAISAVLDGRDFLGQPTRRARVLFLTEERQSTVRRALERAGIHQHPDVEVLLFGAVMRRPWPEVVAGVVAKAKAEGFGIVIVDTLSRWAAIVDDGENSAGEAAQAMRPLEEAAAQGLAVLVIRHERKGGGDITEAARGSTAFGGAADIILNLRRANTPGHPSRRVLRGVGRFEEVPEEVVIELGPGGYEVLGDGVAVERAAAIDWLREHLRPPTPGPPGLEGDHGAIGNDRARDRTEHHPTSPPGNLKPPTR